MDKKEGKRKIEKKKKVKRACLFCQRSHMPCDEGLNSFSFYQNIIFFLKFKLSIV